MNAVLPATLSATQLFRFPDKPSSQIQRAALDQLKPESYIATLKLDGWRCQIVVGSELSSEKPIWGFTYTSRHKKPIPISGGVRDAFERRILDANVPPGTILDAEWVGRRPGPRNNFFLGGGGSEEKLWLFDLLRKGEKGKGEKELWNLGALRRFDDLTMTLSRYGGGGGGAGFGGNWGGLVSYCTFNYGSFYDWNKERRVDAEGIVLKQSSSRYIGSVRQSAGNPGWIKCKWREGESGETKT